MSVLQLISQAGWFVRGVLVILALFSIYSWAIIAYKAVTLRKINRQTKQFLDAFHASPHHNGLEETCQACKASPLVRLFQSTLSVPKSRKRESLERMLRRRSAEEVERLHSHLPFLASAGSTAPFIGLLGTVWGIMNAFRGIGSAHSASLAVVAPAIAEALVTTAAGLIVAIPAVMAYNHFLNENRVIAGWIDEFTQTFAETSEKSA